MEDPADPQFEVAHFMPHYLTLAANTLTAAGSRWFIANYGFGLNEGRIIGALGANPGLTAAELGQQMAMNKSIVSRGLAFLIEKGLVRGEGPARGRRNYITPKCRQTYREIVASSLESQARLLDGFSPGEAEQVLALLKRLSANVTRHYGPEAGNGQ